MSVCNVPKHFDHFIKKYIIATHKILELKGTLENLQSNLILGPISSAEYNYLTDGHPVSNIYCLLIITMLIICECTDRLSSL